MNIQEHIHTHTNSRTKTHTHTNTKLLENFSVILCVKCVCVCVWWCVLPFWFSITCSLSIWRMFSLLLCSVFNCVFDLLSHIIYHPNPYTYTYIVIIIKQSIPLTSFIMQWPWSAAIFQKKKLWCRIQHIHRYDRYYWFKSQLIHIAYALDNLDCFFTINLCVFDFYSDEQCFFVLSLFGFVYNACDLLE